MTDTSKRIDSDGNTLFQIGLESLIPDDGKVYGLKRGTKGSISVIPVEIKQSADTDTDSDTDSDTDTDTDTDKQ